MHTVRASTHVRATIGAMLALSVAAPVLGAALGAQGAATRVATASPAAAVPAAAPITWAAAAAYPMAIDHHVTFVTSGTKGDFLHVIGGHDGTKFRGDAYTAKIARDGSIGAWEAGSGLPAGRAGMAFATDGRYAVLVGGKASDADVTRDVFLANIWGDGRLGAFKAAPFTLPVARFNTGAAIVDGHVYVMGGSDGTSATNTVFRAKISRTGELGSWTTLDALPGARSHHAVVVHGGAIYLLGGNAGDATDAKPLGDVLRATVNKDGSLGAWQAVSALDVPFATHAAVVKDGYLYVIGGVEENARSSDRVLRAAIAKDGTLGAWEVTAGTLPAARGHVHQVPVLRDHLFSVGGSRSGKALDDVVVGKFID